MRQTITGQTAKILTIGVLAASLLAPAWAGEKSKNKQVALSQAGFTMKSSAMPDKKIRKARKSSAQKQVKRKMSVNKTNVVRRSSGKSTGKQTKRKAKTSSPSVIKSYAAIREHRKSKKSAKLKARRVKDFAKVGSANQNAFDVAKQGSRNRKDAIDRQVAGFNAVNPKIAVIADTHHASHGFEDVRESDARFFGSSLGSGESDAARSNDPFGFGRPSDNSPASSVGIESGNFADADSEQGRRDFGATYLAGPGSQSGTRTFHRGPNTSAVDSGLNNREGATGSNSAGTGTHVGYEMVTDDGYLRSFVNATNDFLNNGFDGERDGTAAITGRALTAPLWLPVGIHWSSLADIVVEGSKGNLFAAVGFTPPRNDDDSESSGGDEPDGANDTNSGCRDDRVVTPGDCGSPGDERRAAQNRERIRGDHDSQPNPAEAGDESAVCSFVDCRSGQQTNPLEMLGQPDANGGWGQESSHSRDFIEEQEWVTDPEG